MRWVNLRKLQLIHGVRVGAGECPIHDTKWVSQGRSSEIALWCRITSSMMKFKNFSANSGSKSASRLSSCNRLIWAFSRSGSLGGRLCRALSSPTFLVHLKRSASRYTSVASMLSMLARMARSSSRMAGSVVPVNEDAVESYVIVSSLDLRQALGVDRLDRKSTRLNSSHVAISYAVFCLKKKTNSYHNHS